MCAQTQISSTVTEHYCQTKRLCAAYPRAEQLHATATKGPGWKGRMLARPRAPRSSGCTAPLWHPHRWYQEVLEGLGAELGCPHVLALRAEVLQEPGRALRAGVGAGCHRSDQGAGGHLLYCIPPALRAPGTRSLGIRKDGTGVSAQGLLRRVRCCALKWAGCVHH